ncbi:hypothetical protein SLH46_06110 [Draconibacterium sp. IB214405]|uniref:hypothetical protein n=1 Tax=Draconibacterium sp. IB214405 TaxID=3097352 RepID=UPI002A1861D2|nr:hypothetical protein [Draconibacterium sp. IB214405]MDX8338746.1 hypothetical protein [Draconibacterium sp. IB214405]
MKNIQLALLVFVLAFAACDQDNIGELYETDAYVAFSSSIVVDNLLTAENNYSVSVQVVRTDGTGTETVSITLEPNDNIDGVFELESNTVTFNDGETVAYAKIVPLVAATEIAPGVTFNFNMSLSDATVSEFFGTTTYKASLKLDFTSIGTGTFDSPFWGEVLQPEVYQASLGSVTLYKAMGLFETGYDIIFIVDGTTVTVNDQPAWYYDDEYGEVYITGSGTIDGKVMTLTLTHFIPDVYAWDASVETFTLP